MLPGLPSLPDCSLLRPLRRGRQAGTHSHRARRPAGIGALSQTVAKGMLATIARAGSATGR